MENDSIKHVSILLCVFAGATPTSNSETAEVGYETKVKFTAEIKVSIEC